MAHPRILLLATPLILLFVRSGKEYCCNVNCQLGFGNFKIPPLNDRFLTKPSKKIFVVILYQNLSGEYNWVCEPVDYGNSPMARRALNLAWWYYFSKFIDLADSLFFVARKKFGHLSPLHIIHHSTLPLLCWWGPR